MYKKENSQKHDFCKKIQKPKKKNPFFFRSNSMLFAESQVTKSFSDSSFTDTC